MNIYRQEIKMSARSWIYFTVSLIGLLAIFATFFNFFKEDAAIIDRLLDNFPLEFRAAFGFADVNLSQIEGYFSFIFSYIILIGAIYAMKTGVTILSEEGRRMTSDFLLSKPVTRVSIVSNKLAVLLTNIILQNLLIYACGYLILSTFIKEPFDITIFTLMSFSLLFVQLFFAGIGLFIAALSNKIRSVTPISMGIVFFFFIINLINESVREKLLAYVTPFAHFKGSSIISDMQYNIVYVLVDIAVFAIFTILAYRVFIRKDIHAV